MTQEYVPEQKKLTVRGASEFPRDILDRGDDIEILDISFTDIHELPADFARLRRLRVFFASYTPFTELPPQLKDCPELKMIGMKTCRITGFAEDMLPLGLEALTLTENKLTALPRSLGKLKHLKKLMVAGNQLESLPRELLQCTDLEGLRIAANNLREEPSWLLQLPRLAWYSDSGNPFSPAPRHETTLPTIPWGDLKLHEKIGESAKNVVYRATDPGGRDIAIKVYGNDVTTDGYPADELHAILTAGEHAGLIRPLARVTGEPEGRQALARELIPQAFQAPGNIPDLITHVRDTYPAGKTFALPYIIQLLQDIAGAVAHLHSRGVLHGDIYAHNILADASGQAYLCDLGGASLFEASGARRTHIDALAFGLLAGELASRCPEKDAAEQARRQLIERCTTRQTVVRPDFVQGAAMLQAA